MRVALGDTKALIFLLKNYLLSRRSASLRCIQLPEP